MSTILDLIDKKRGLVSILDHIQHEIAKVDASIEWLQTHNFGTLKVGDKVIYQSSSFLNTSEPHIYEVTKVEKIDDEHINLEAKCGESILKYKSLYCLTDEVNDGDAYDWFQLKLAIE